MIGRLLYNVNQKDNWQVMPFLIGKGKTGKSSLLKIISKFYNDEDVAVLSNNAQKGFGLETIYNKYIWMCYETKNDFSLDQGQLQSMISGENVSIQRKFKEAISVEWMTPGILAGNEAPLWTDNSGSISRRFLLMYFDKTVKNDKVDPNLEMKAKAQIGNTLHKMTKAYHELVFLYGSKDVWAENVLPKYFHLSKKRLQKITHDLVNFIEAENSLMYRKDIFMPFKRFKEMFKIYAETSGMKRFTWNEGKYETTFEEYNIEKRKLDQKTIDEKNLSYKNEVPKPGDEWLFGVSEINAITNNEIIEDNALNNIVIETIENIQQPESVIKTPFMFKRRKTNNDG